MAIIGFIIVGIILIAIFKTAQTKNDFNNPLFQFYVDKYVTEYITQTGSEPPNYLMPEIYKRARNEIKNMGSETPSLNESALNEAEAWLVKNKILPNSVMATTYNEPWLSRNSGAKAIAGIGKTVDGQEIGFALEITVGRGVVESIILTPPAIATWHKKAAVEAKLSGQSLACTLDRMAIAHRNANRTGIAPPPKEPQKPAMNPKEARAFNGPAIKNAMPIRSYENNGFNAVLINKIESIGVISYLYALLVFQDGEESPRLFVTAEINSMAAEMMGSLPKELQEEMGNMTSAPFLGVFSEEGRQNLGSSPNYSSIDGFEIAALSTAKKYLKFSEPLLRTK